MNSENIKYIDTHTHPQLRQYNADRDEVIQRAFEAGVGMICVGVDLESSNQAIELAQKNENIWASVGLHPNDNLDEKYEQAIYAESAQKEKVVAIGEIGLDYYRTTDPAKKEFQKERFLQQISLAQELKKPLIIHCRDAHDDMYEILKNHHGLRGVIHSFTGTWSEVQRYIDLGFYIGLNGIITFARQYDESIKNIPLDKILLETDAPFLTPEPHRGQRNESSYLPFIAQKIADIKNISIEEFASQTTENAGELFGL